MGTREMPHPLCCISLDLVGLGARSPSPADPPPRAGEGEAGPADSVTFCGALYKWTNIRKGWRLRWFSLHDGVLSYSKIARRELPTVPSGSGVRLIGNSSSMFASSHSRGGCGCRQPRMPVRLVQLKFSCCCEISVLSERSPKHRTDGEDIASESEQRDPEARTDRVETTPAGQKEGRNGKSVEYIT